MVTYGFDYAGKQLEKTIADLEDLATLIGQVNSEIIELNCGTKLCPGLGMITEAEDTKKKIHDLREGIFNVLIIGRIRSGRIHLINSILGSNLFGLTPITITTKIIFGTDEAVAIHKYNQMEPLKISVSNFNENFALTMDDIKYMTGTGFVNRFKDYEYAQIENLSPLCKNGVKLILSPSIEESKNLDLFTRTYFPQAQAIVFVLTADQILNQKEREFISKNILNKNVTNVFFVITRVDTLRKQTDRTEIESIVYKYLYPLYNNDDLYKRRVFFVSALDAIDACTEGQTDENLLEKSNIPRFEKELENYLTSKETLKKVFLPIKKYYQIVINKAYEEVANQINVQKTKYDILSMHEKSRLIKIQTQLLELSKENQCDIFSIQEIKKINDHCSRIPYIGDVPNDLSVILNKIQKYVYRYNDSAIRISFFGSFSAGKSSLINALLDVPLVPAKANRSTGVITTVRYADDTSAQIIHNSSEKEIDINFDDRNKYILIDSLGSNEYSSHEVKEVRLNIPNSLLEEGIVFVDTPGIQDDDKLTEIAFEACEYSDLVIMVLNGSRILSDTEKESINYINETLNGNIIFALNKFDSLKTDEDREEISNITSHVLRKMGNNNVGNPRIYHVVSEDIPSACDQRITAVNQLNDLREWIINLLSSPSGKQIIWNARFSVAEKYINEFNTLIEAYLQKESEYIKEIINEINDHERQVQRSHEKKVNSLIYDIYQVEAMLKKCMDDCFDIWIQKLDKYISSNSNWNNSDLLSSLKEEISNYCNKVNDSYSSTLRNIQYLGISSISYDIDVSKIPISVSPVENSNYNKVCGAGALVGGLVAGPLGLVVGGILTAAAVNQYDGKATLNLAKSKKQDLFQFLTQKNTQYSQLLEQRICKSVPKNAQNQKLSSKLSIAEKRRDNYLELKQWCNDLSYIIQDARRKNV